MTPSDSEMESDYDQESHHHSDPGSHIASPDNMPNPDKPDRKKKMSDRKETPSKSHSRGGHLGECAHDRAAHRLGEELAQKYADEDEERQSRSKKPKKGSSSRKETSATWDSSEENEHERKGREKKRKPKPGKLSSGWREKKGKKKIKNLPGRNYSTNIRGRNTAMSVQNSGSTGESTSRWSKWSLSTWTTTLPLNPDPAEQIPVSPPEHHVSCLVTQATQRSWHGRESKPG